MEFKTPDKPTREKPISLPKQYVEDVIGSLRNGNYASAFRTLSTIASGRYAPKRDLYAQLWHHMLLARAPCDAYQCYEALKLLQATYPAGGEGAFCPRAANDYDVLMECLEVTRPKEEEEEEEEEGEKSDGRDEEEEDDKKKKKRKKQQQEAKGSGSKKRSREDLHEKSDSSDDLSSKIKGRKFPEWTFHLITHGPSCPARSREPVSRVEYGGVGPSQCRQHSSCRKTKHDSPYIALLLRYFVMLLTENARALPPERYAESAVVQMLMPQGNAQRWTEVASILIEGIGSQQLTSDVADTYFALLHLLVDVCGHKSNPQQEQVVMIWLSKAGVPLLQASAENFNDGLAYLLHQSKWWSMKLQLVNTMLMVNFSADEVKHKELLENAHKPNQAAGRLIHVYFNLRPKAGLSQGEVNLFDTESLVILVATAWQCVFSLQDECGELWDQVKKNRPLIRQSFEVFDKKIVRLSTMRRVSSHDHVRIAERTRMYMCLLRALVCTAD